MQLYYNDVQMWAHAWEHVCMCVCTCDIACIHLTFTPLGYDHIAKQSEKPKGIRIQYYDHVMILSLMHKHKWEAS